jgi:hypothetical protein
VAHALAAIGESAQASSHVWMDDLPNDVNVLVWPAIWLCLLINGINVFHVKKHYE